MTKQFNDLLNNLPPDRRKQIEERVQAALAEMTDEQDEYPKITQADLDRATFRVGLKPAHE